MWRRAPRACRQRTSAPSEAEATPGTPRRNHAQALTRRGVSSSLTASGRPGQEECAQLVDGRDAERRVVALVRVAESPAHEDHGNAVGETALDIMVPVADEDRAGGVGAEFAQPSQRLGDDVGLGGERGLVRRGAHGREERRPESEVIDQGVDLVLGLRARRRLGDTRRVQVVDQLGDARIRPHVGRVPVGLAEGAVERHGLGRLLRRHPRLVLEGLEHGRTDPVHELFPRRRRVAEVCQGDVQATQDPDRGVDDGPVDVPEHTRVRRRGHASSLGSRERVPARPAQVCTKRVYPPNT